MFSKLLVGVFIVLSSVAANAQSSMTVTASNNSVAADVGIGSGFIDFFIPTSKPPSRLSNPGHSYLTVDVNGKFYTNNPDLQANATPAAPTQILMNSSATLHKDKSGSTNDTRRTIR